MNILIVGGGAMGQSIVKGILHSNKVHSCVVLEHNEQHALSIEDLGVKVFGDAKSVFEDSASQHFDVCLLAVKPNDVASVSQQIKGFLSPSCVVVSIAAGISIDVLQHNFDGVGIVRAMPNIAAGQLASATAFCVGELVTETQLENVKEILSSFGSTVRVAEEQLNLVTAISGSGPAYFFLLAELLLNSAIEQGMESETAQLLVAQTFLGAAKMVNEQGSFKTLRESVTSKGGTTQAAIEVFDKKDLSGTISEAITAAVARAEELNSSNPGKD